MIVKFFVPFWCKIETLVIVMFLHFLLRAKQTIVSYKNKLHM